MKAMSKLSVADYLQIELDKDFLVFPLPCRYNSISDGAFYKAWSEGVGVGMGADSDSDSVLTHFDTTTCSVVK